MQPRKESVPKLMPWIAVVADGAEADIFRLAATARCEDPRHFLGENDNIESNNPYFPGMHGTGNLRLRQERSQPLRESGCLSVITKLIIHFDEVPASVGRPYRVHHYSPLHYGLREDADFVESIDGRTTFPEAVLSSKQIGR